MMLLYLLIEFIQIIQIIESRGNIPRCKDQASCLKAIIGEEAGQCTYELCVSYNPAINECAKIVSESIDYICLTEGGSKNTCSSSDESFCCGDCDNTGSIHPSQGLCRNTAMGNTANCGGTMFCIDIPYNKQVVFGINDGNKECDTEPFVTDLGSGVGPIFQCKKGNVCNGNNKKECKWTVMRANTECPIPAKPAHRASFEHHIKDLDHPMSEQHVNSKKSAHSSLSKFWAVKLGLITFIIIIFWCYRRKHKKEAIIYESDASDPCNSLP